MNTIDMGRGSAAPSLENVHGQMTAAMRSVARNAAQNVLRIGRIHRGKIVEECLIKARTSVTVGENEDAMFVVAAPNVPPAFKLFERIGGDYYLNFLDGMTGRIALATGIAELASLRGRGNRNAAGVYYIKLNEEARGKVVVGDTAFLFQFVAAPPAQLRAQLPLAVKTGIARKIDWSLTIVAAFSFLAHFGIAGAMYSDWMDRPVDNGATVGLVDMMKSIPTTLAPEPPLAPMAVARTAAPTATTHAPGSTPTGTSRPGAVKPSDAPTDRATLALANRAADLQIGMVAAVQGGPSTQAALRRSEEIPPVDLTDAAARDGGVTGMSDLNLRGGRALQSGKQDGLSRLAGNTTGSDIGKDGGPGRDIKPVMVDAQLGPMSPTVHVSDLDRVVAGLRPKFRACYQQGLSADPTMSGNVVIAVKIRPTGEVDSATPTDRAGLSEAVGACIARHVVNAQFAAPGGSGSQVRIPVTFVRQGR